MNSHQGRLPVALWMARRRAERHMGLSEQAGFTWGEETITELVLVGASPAVATYPFTRREEGGDTGTGADWLWWWIDPDGTSFGMLVQAKRLKKKNKQGVWNIDFEYKAGAQRKRLLTTAKKLGVAATYVLYFGSTDYTSDIQPPEDDPHHDHWNPDVAARKWCEECRRRTVAYLPAHITLSSNLSANAPKAYRDSVPLEDLAHKQTEFKAPLVIPTVRDELPPKLVAFIDHQQQGARHVAHTFLAQVLRHRMGQSTLSVAERVQAVPDNQITDEPYFEEWPDDRDHSGQQYFPAILRGLRKAPPRYVLNLEYGEIPHLPNELGLNEEELEGIAGMVVIRTEGNKAG